MNKRVLIPSLVFFITSIYLTIQRGQRSLLLFNAYNDVVESASLSPTYTPLAPSVAPSVSPDEVVHAEEEVKGPDSTVLNWTSNDSLHSINRTGLSLSVGDDEACTAPLRVIYLPRERATRGITDRITRILALVSVSAVTRSVLHLQAPRYFIGTRHNRRIPRRGVTQWWDGYLNLTALDVKVRHASGWNPCGGIVQKVHSEFNYSAWMEDSHQCVKRWTMNVKPVEQPDTLEEPIFDVCGVPDLDDFARWFRPIVRGGFLWYSKTRGLFRAAHAGAYPMAQRLVDSALSVARQLGWPRTAFVAVKLRLSDKAKYVAEVDCTSAQRVVATVQAKLNSSGVSDDPSVAMPLFLMTDETNVTFVQDLRTRLLHIPYISAVFMESDFSGLNKIRQEQRDEPGSFLAALLVHRLAAFRFVTFERERFENEEQLPPHEGILSARSSEVLCPGVVNRFRRWQRSSRKRKRRTRRKIPSHSSQLAT